MGGTSRKTTRSFNFARKPSQRTGKPTRVGFHRRLFNCSVRRCSRPSHSSLSKTLIRQTRPSSITRPARSAFRRDKREDEIFREFLTGLAQSVENKRQQCGLFREIRNRRRSSTADAMPAAAAIDAKVLKRLSRTLSDRPAAMGQIRNGQVPTPMSGSNTTAGAPPTQSLPPLLPL